MPQDFNKALDSLRGMLSTEDGKQNLEKSIIGSFSGDSNSNYDEMQPAPPTVPNNINSLDANLMMGMKHVMDELGNNNTQSANLLSALRPYLSSNRYKHVDTAIQIMKLSKLPGVFKNPKK